MRSRGTSNACRLSSNQVLFKVKKQEKIEKERRNREEMQARGQQTQNMLESLDNYYNFQMEMLQTQLKSEQVGRQAVE